MTDRRPEKGSDIMTRFIPREKMGRKARREMDGRNRVIWPFPPVTKKIESGKRYDRHRKTRGRQEDDRGF